MIRNVIRWTLNVDRFFRIFLIFNKEGIKLLYIFSIGIFS